MRVSVLKQDLLGLDSTLKPSSRGSILSHGEKGYGFGAVFSRAPLFADNKQPLSTKVLDRGFFFPITPGKVRGGMPYKRFTMKAKSRKGQTPVKRRISMY